DEVHNYGHGKVESLAAFVETGIMFASCIWIVYEAVGRIVLHRHLALLPSLWPFAVLLVSIVVDFSRSRTLGRIARQHRSPLSPPTPSTSPPTCGPRWPSCSAWGPPTRANASPAPGWSTPTPSPLWWSPESSCASVGGLPTRPSTPCWTPRPPPTPPVTSRSPRTSYAPIFCTTSRPSPACSRWNACAPAAPAPTTSPTSPSACPATSPSSAPNSSPWPPRWPCSATCPPPTSSFTPYPPHRLRRASTTASAPLPPAVTSPFTRSVCNRSPGNSTTASILSCTSSSIWRSMRPCLCARPTSWSPHSRPRCAARSPPSPPSSPTSRASRPPSSAPPRWSATASWNSAYAASPPPSPRSSTSTRSTSPATAPASFLPPRTPRLPLPPRPASSLQLKTCNLQLAPFPSTPRYPATARCQTISPWPAYTPSSPRWKAHSNSTPPRSTTCSSTPNPPPTTAARGPL